MLKIKYLLYAMISWLINHWLFSSNARFHPIKFLRLFPRTVITQVNGVSYNIDPLDQVEFNTFRGFSIGPESIFSKYLASTLTKNDVFFDLGAHTGRHTLPAAKYVGPTGRVFAFEPIHTSFAKLHSNIALNSFNNVVTINKAVLDTPNEIIEIYIQPTIPKESTNTGDSSISSLKMINQQLSSKLFVTTTTIDEIVMQHQIDEIKLMKIDVQGGELQVLNGALSTLKNNIIQNIYIEVHLKELQSLGGNYLDILKLLNQYGTTYFFDSALVNQSKKEIKIVTPSTLNEYFSESEVTSSGNQPIINAPEAQLLWEKST